MFFLATADAEVARLLVQGRPARFRQGARRPHARVPELRRQRHVPSLGNIAVNPKVGLLFIDFERPTACG